MELFSSLVLKSMNWMTVLARLRDVRGSMVNDELRGE
jgi:hypothetical protein